MTTLPAGWAAKVNNLQGTAPFVWCWQIPLHIDDTLNLFVALTGHPEPVTIGSVKFYPYPMKQSPIEHDGDGNMPSLVLSIDNSARLLAPYLESPGDERGLLGRLAQGYLTDAAQPTTTLLWEFEIQSASLTGDTVSLRMEQRNLFGIKKPQDRFSTSRCRHVFGSTACGYVINGVAAFTTCPKTVTACRARGQDMAARNLPVLQPGTFGGFLGIPRQ